MRPRTEQFALYWDEHHQYPYFKKGKLKSYYRKKFYRKYFKEGTLTIKKGIAN